MLADGNVGLMNFRDRSSSTLWPTLWLSGLCPSVYVRIHSFPNTTFWDSLACLSLGPHGPSISPVLCGPSLTHLTGLTCCKEVCRFWGVWFLCGCFFGALVRLAFWFVFVPFTSLHALALSLTGAQCTKQQSREQKNALAVNGACWLQEIHSKFLDRARSGTSTLILIFVPNNL